MNNRPAENPQLAVEALSFVSQAVCRHAAATEDAPAKKRLLRYTLSIPGNAGIEYEIPENRVLIAAMCGPRGCGKTTLLTTLIRSFDYLSDEMLAIEPVSLEQLTYQENRLSNLRRKAISPSESAGILPTIQAEICEFLIYHREHPRGVFLLRFVDIPGSWMDECPQAARQLLEQADIIFSPIHTPALLEGGIPRDTLVQPAELSTLLHTLASCAPRRRLLMFVPVKCEKYYREQIMLGRVNAMCRICETIEEQFESTISMLRSAQTTRNLLTIGIAPVLTMGGASFARFIPITKDNVPSVNEEYVRTDERHPALHGYIPRFDEQPMRYILRFIYDLLRSGACRDSMGAFFKDCSAYGIGRAFKYAYHNPLYEYLNTSVHITDLAALEGFQAFVPPMTYDPEHPWSLPNGVHINNDILGIRILHDPLNIFDTNALPAPQKKNPKR